MPIVRADEPHLSTSDMTRMCTPSLGRAWCWNYQDRQQPRPEPLIKDEYSVQDFIELREKSLQLSVYAELKRRGIARDEAKDIVRTAFDTDKNGWDETLSDATKNALVQVKLPLHPPDKQGPPESPSMPDS